MIKATKPEVRSILNLNGDEIAIAKRKSVLIPVVLLSRLALLSLALAISRLWLPPATEAATAVVAWCTVTHVSACKFLFICLLNLNWNWTTISSFSSISFLFDVAKVCICWSMRGYCSSDVVLLFRIQLVGWLEVMILGWCSFVIEGLERGLSQLRFYADGSFLWHSDYLLRSQEHRKKIIPTHRILAIE